MVNRPPEWNVWPNGPPSSTRVSPTPSWPLNCGELVVTSGGRSADFVHHIRYSADVHQRPIPRTRPTASVPTGQSPYSGASSPGGQTSPPSGETDGTTTAGAPEAGVVCSGEAVPVPRSSITVGRTTGAS